MTILQVPTVVTALATMRAALRNKRQEAPSSAFMRSPFYRFDPSLITEVGNVHWRAALRGLFGALGCWVFVFLFGVIL